ncbi:MAG TPA: PAS domain S-box protein, partial [Coleofasciculaceae cyanobacterium]
RPFWEARWWSLYPQTQDRLKAAIAKAAAGEFVRYEVDVLGAGGRVVTIDFSLKPVKDETGQVVLLIPEGRDISDKKQAEKDLRESEQRFRATFDQAAVGIAHIDLDGKFLRINQKFCDLVGYTQEEMLTQSLQDITHPDDMEVDLADVRQVLSGEIQMYSVEKRYISRNRGIVWINLTVSLRRRSSGEPKYFISVVQDISDRKQAEVALRRSESQLRLKNHQLQETLRQLKQTQTQLIQNEKMVSLGQMVAGIAHEINNPISFIYGNVTYADEYAQYLLNLVKLYRLHYPEPVREIQDEIEAFDLDFIARDFPKVLRSMQEGANRIREIVLCLRNFSRLDEAEIKPVNLHEGIDNTLLILQHRLKGHAGNPEIELRKEYGQLPLVECYAGSLNQVFMNLLINAIDALEPQSAPRVISICTELKAGKNPANPQSVVIRIADNGPGIPSKVKQQIFDPFFTTKPIGVGTGLGLSIAYSIVVEKHRGTLTCHSVPGKGAEFVIELPVRQPKPS